jgi:Xaa-Pro aminopeptidase
MEEHNVDVLIVCPEWITSDSLYIADTHGVTILPRDGEPTLILGGEASNLAVEQPSWVDDRVSDSGSGSTAASYGRSTVDALRRRGFLDRNIAITGIKGHTLVSVRQPGGYASYTTVKTIADAASQPIVDGSPILGEARYVKSEEEIARLAASLRVAEASIEAMLDAAAGGIRQAEVFAQMLGAQVRAAADELHVAWCPGRWGEHRHRYVTTPRGRLESGVSVSIEPMPEIRGYQAQAAQPLVTGKPSARAEEIFELNTRAFDRACETLKPGATWAEVEDAAKAVADGTAYTISLLLHGRGLGNDGPLLTPSDSHSFGREFQVRAGTTFILKPFAIAEGATSPITRAYDVTLGGHDCDPPGWRRTARDARAVPADPMSRGSASKAHQHRGDAGRNRARLVELPYRSKGTDETRQLRNRGQEGDVVWDPDRRRGRRNSPCRRTSRSDLQPAHRIRVDSRTARS